jgi:hypothetical protein
MTVLTWIVLASFVTVAFVAAMLWFIRAADRARDTQRVQEGKPPRHDEP